MRLLWIGDVSCRFSRLWPTHEDADGLLIFSRGRFKENELYFQYFFHWYLLLRNQYSSSSLYSKINFVFICWISCSEMVMSVCASTICLVSEEMYLAALEEFVFFHSEIYRRHLWRCIGKEISCSIPSPRHPCPITDLNLCFLYISDHKWSFYAQLQSFYELLQS